jgi:hypothetical protein
MKKVFLIALFIVLTLGGSCMIGKLVETLFWRYQEKENWKMKMNEPIAIRKLSPEEVQEILLNRRQKKIQ